MSNPDRLQREAEDHAEFLIEDRGPTTARDWAVHCAVRDTGGFWQRVVREIDRQVSARNAAITLSKGQRPMKRTNTKLDQRERDTIIAALRFWQAHMEGRVGVTFSRRPELIEIACNDREGDDAMLSVDEIDALIEGRVNA